MRNISAQLFRIWTRNAGDIVQRNFSPSSRVYVVLTISYPALWQPLCSAEQNHLCHFGRVHHEEQFCEIIFNLDLWFRRKCHLKIFLIWSSGSPFFSRAEQVVFIW